MQQKEEMNSEHRRDVMKEAAVGNLAKPFGCPVQRLRFIIITRSMAI